MKKLFTFLFYLLLSFNLFAQWVPTNEVNGTYDASSYDVGFTSYMGDYFATYFYCMYPQYTNHIYSWSRSGSGWNGDYQVQEEKWCLPIWHSFRVPGYNWILANDNEGLVSNTTYSAGLLLAAAPPLFFNGFAQTNEGDLTVSIQTIPLGRMPHDSSDGDSGAVAGNDGSMALARTLGVNEIDLWYKTWITDGINNDTIGNRYAWHPNISGSHFSAGGGLIGTTEQLRGLNVETNVGTLTLDWGRHKAYTNHCAAININVNNNVLTTTVKFDRMPMAFDANGGSIIGALTNDARYAFLIAPALGNAFNWIIQVTNLPLGRYGIDVDGYYADSCTSAELAVGRNWYTNCVPTNPLWQQRSNVLAWQRWKKGADPATLNVIIGGDHVSHISSAVDTIFYQSNTGLPYDAPNNLRGIAFLTNIINTISMTNNMVLFQKYDVAIHDAAQQTNHTFRIYRLNDIELRGKSIILRGKGVILR